MGCQRVFQLSIFCRKGPRGGVGHRAAQYDSSGFSGPPRSFFVINFFMNRLRWSEDKVIVRVYWQVIFFSIAHFSQSYISLNIGTTISSVAVLTFELLGEDPSGPLRPLRFLFQKTGKARPTPSPTAFCERLCDPRFLRAVPGYQPATPVFLGHSGSIEALRTDAVVPTPRRDPPSTFRAPKTRRGTSRNDYGNSAT